MASGLSFETLQAQSGSNILVPAGHVFEATTGAVKIPNWTNSTRPTGVTGMIGLNTQEDFVEFYDGNEWVQAGQVGNDGSAADRAALDGVTLVSDFPDLGNGIYWIKSNDMPNALEMYVDFTEDGGGYDFYATRGSGPSFSNINSDPNTFGLKLFMPRSKYAWRAASKAVAAMDGGNFGSYWSTCYAVYKTGGGGNYTGCNMRSGQYGGNNCGSWRTTDGGKWWLRDSSFGEPNGDYNGNTFLYMYGGQIGNPYGLNNIGFNDARGGPSTGSRYLISTNTKA